MPKITMHYKGTNWKLDEYEMRTQIIDGREVKMVYCRYKGHEIFEPTLPQVRGKLEKIFDDELKVVEGLK